MLSLAALMWCGWGRSARRPGAQTVERILGANPSTHLLLSDVGPVSETPSTPSTEVTAVTEARS